MELRILPEVQLYWKICHPHFNYVLILHAKCQFSLHALNKSHTRIARNLCCYR